MDFEIEVASLHIPGDWQGPETAGQWWCIQCGLWAACDDQDICEKCDPADRCSTTPAALFY